MSSVVNPRLADTEHLRVPPHSIDAEQSVIGGLMLDNKAWDKIADVVSDVDFYRQDHRLIFTAIAELAEANQPSDVITVGEQLTKHEVLDQVGGTAYLASLAGETPSAANIRAYAEIVRDRSLLRQLIQVGGEIAGSAYRTEGREVSELVDDAERQVLQIAESGKRRGSGFLSLRQVLPGTIDRLDFLHNSDSDITGVATGYNKLDEMTAGLQKGDLIIIAGRPSMGKTSLALNIAEHAAIKSGIHTAIFSMEMSAEQLSFRLISSLGNISQSKLRTGRFGDEDWPSINSAVNLMSDAPIFIDDTPALSPTEVRARARRLKREHGLGLIVLDYLQLMQVNGSNENRATELSEISRSLKALAKEMNVPVIALSQLNRSVEQRPGKKPQMSDLRESGAIEQDADLIAFIFREEVYEPETPRKGIADIIVAKQRNGPTGDLQLTFLNTLTRFENYVPDSYGNEPFFPTDNTSPF